MITLIHQQNRIKDELGRLITTVEDVKLAIELTSDIFITKADTLTSTNREFLEELKIYLNSVVEKDQEITDVVFRADELFNVINGGISSIYRKIDNLIKIGLIHQVGGNRKTGQKLRLAYNDEYEVLVQRIHNQVNKFSSENQKPEVI